MDPTTSMWIERARVLHQWNDGILFVKTQSKDVVMGKLFTHNHLTIQEEQSWN